MSLERACVNCERCYHLANLAIQDDRIVKFESAINVGNESTEEKIARINALKLDSRVRRVACYEDNTVYTARNEAMGALEEVIGRCESIATALNPNNFSREYASTYAPLAEKALRACRTCDYSSPKIVETVENLSQLKESD